jgi:hypothetical protein
MDRTKHSGKCVIRFQAAQFAGFYRLWTIPDQLLHRQILGTDGGFTKKITQRKGVTHSPAPAVWRQTVCLPNSSFFESSVRIVKRPIPATARWFRNLRIKTP